MHLIELMLGSLSPPASHSSEFPLLVSEPQGPQGGAAVESIHEQSPLEQCVSMIVWDLITVMCREGLKVSNEDVNDECT